MRRHLVTGLLAALMIGQAPAALAKQAGSVIFARGEVTAERDPPEPLAKGDPVIATDAIVTGEASRAQLLMIDNAKIAIRPNSRLVIDEYQYVPPAAATFSGATDKTALSLVKGGFRTITGAIGKEADDEYEVRTPVGVLGIRGTDYAAVFCRGDCTPAVPDGLYLAVYDGIISFTTATETIELRAGEFAFIPLDTPQPRRLDDPPAVLMDDDDLSFDPGTGDQSKTRPDDGSATGFNATLGTRRAPSASSAKSAGPGEDGSDPAASEPPKQPTNAIDADGTPVDITPGDQPPPNDPRTISYSGPGLPPLDLALSGISDNQPGEFDVDFDNNLVHFVTPIGGRIGGSPTQIEIGSATLADAGFDSMTVMRWGRWTGGTIDVTDVPTSVSTPISLANQSIHWVSGPAGAPPTMPLIGNANYTLIGNTNPTDNLGNIGTLGSASFQADFTNMFVDSTLNIDIAGTNWVASGRGQIGAQAGLADHLFQGLYNAVIVGGVSGGSGQFSGFFSGPGQTSDPTFPGSVGLTFSLQDSQGASTVSGAAVFGNP